MDNLGIEHPNCRHIAIESGLVVHWHGKLHQEDLISAVKSICMLSAIVQV
jgi:hypothetical protein